MKTEVLPTEEARREFAQQLMRRLVPSDVGSKEFMAIAQGRAEQAAKRQKFFSTCGELAMALLHAMGYRGPLLNRQLVGDAGNLLYVYGQNMKYLVTRARQHGHFVNFKPHTENAEENRPKTGDICYIMEPSGKREHVFVFDREENGKWHSFDAGQLCGPNSWDQCARVRERELTGKYLRGRNADARLLIGWVDISTLPLTVAPSLLVE
jgi:hypothetical protein